MIDPQPSPFDDPFQRCLRRLDQLPQGSDYLTSLAQRYSYVFPEAALLDALRDHSPLVEVGAGTGYWAYRLRQMGADVVAYDQAPPNSERINRYHGDMTSWTEVQEGDERVLAGHGDRTLFICWPPIFSTLGRCLTFYPGNVIACITDGGYRTAHVSGLEDGFYEIASHAARALEPAPGRHARLSIWLRRGAGSGPGPRPNHSRPDFFAAGRD